MKIIVCAKQVPNTTEMKVDKETGTLIREGVKTIINPDDLASIECALRIKDQIPETTITVITMGPLQARSMLVDCYGYGVDQCILISDRAFGGSDTWATSTILSDAIRKLDYDLILAGRQAIDGDTAQVGPQIAEHLQIPQVTTVKSIDKVKREVVEVTKSYETYEERLRVKTPCLLTIQAETIAIRQPTIPDIWCADEKEIVVLTNEELQCEAHNIGLKGSLTRVKKTFTRPLETKGEMIENDIDLAAKRIAEIIVKASS